MGFVEWIKPVIDVILTPFKKVGEFITWIGQKTGLISSDDAMPSFTDRTTTDIGSSTSLDVSAPAAASISAPVFGGTSTQMALAGGAGAAAAKTTAVVNRANGNSEALDFTMGCMFDNPFGETSAISIAAGSDVMEDIGKQAAISFPLASPKEAPALDNTPWTKPSETPAKKTASIVVQNLTVQAEDCQSLLDFVRVLYDAANREVEVEV